MGQAGASWERLGQAGAGWGRQGTGWSFQCQVSTGLWGTLLSSTETLPPPPLALSVTSLDFQTSDVETGQHLRPFLGVCYLDM